VKNKTKQTVLVKIHVPLNLFLNDTCIPSTSLFIEKRMKVKEIKWLPSYRSISSVIDYDSNSDTEYKISFLPPLAHVK
jgi:hypothetical protein